MNIRYAEFDEMDEIEVDGKSYECQSDFGFEYLEESSGEKSCGYPIEPFRFSRIVNDDFGYLFDAKGIIWIYGKHTIGGDRMFYRSCFKDCSFQILLKEDSDFDYESLNKHLDSGFAFFSSDLANGMKSRYNTESGGQ